KAVPVVEWVGTCAVPREFTAARRLLARGAPVRWIAQQGAVFHNLRGDVPRRGYDSRNRWRRHRGDAGVVIARAEREEGDDECEGAAKSALHGMILLVQSECEYATRSKPATRDLRSEEHTSELQSPCNLVCRLLLEKKKKKHKKQNIITKKIINERNER